MLEVSFCKYYNADGDFFQEHFFKLKGVFIMKDVDFYEDRDGFYREIYRDDIKKLVDELEDVDAIRVLLDYAFGYRELQKAKAKSKARATV